MRPTATTCAIKLFLQHLDAVFVQAEKTPLTPEDCAYLKEAARMFATAIERDDITSWLPMPGAVQ